ncbi:MAG: Holliday junction DNA helicase RuvA [Candidatus Yanofskybacteria bacterium RIFCSPHIGHO2_01_FULL_39_8b]|uniref:Holliday junction branch migration complex subunit RuvA n=1 Tax=Candidatus Yanofskybacteria bacterium RIFCSPHIGHO2_01_FULL_39_8b TaxID=1802659 RepID=A0A1F8EH77_9BACT|nr:MAG: Holliday junction DNA helicase RuvA [Candidatus Yanofskybacteria bacterium RIFCSPHIGHO2_01_FULL_39_8b]
MISFLEGKIEHLGEKHVILNTGGIGYKVTVVPKLLNILSKSTDIVNPEVTKAAFVKLFIHSQLNMREGTFDMYGFDKREDLELFHLLTSVSGIGPKGAMNILSVVEPKHLKAAVVNEDAGYLKRVSGLGPKIASRLILELKNKVDHIDMGDMKGVDLGQEGQATEALLALGYSQYQAKEALKESRGKTLEEKVREALRLLGKR